MKSTVAISASLENFDKLPSSAYVRLPVVCVLYGVAPATIWRYVQSGRIPAPKKIGPRASGWQVGEIRANKAAIEA